MQVELRVKVLRTSLGSILSSMFQPLMAMVLRPRGSSGLRDAHPVNIIAVSPPGLCVNVGVC